MIFLDALLGMFALLLLMPASLLSLQVVLALLPARIRPSSSSKCPSVAVLMPAHNEALVLEGTMRSIIPQLKSGDRLLVVADNCSDDTARIAAASGAEVIERFDLERRGKGYALDYGMQYLRLAAPEVVIIIDADCKVSKGVIDRLARACAEAGRPIQSLYLMQAPPGASLAVRVAEFAWLVKNYVRPRGFQRIRLPCQLTGTGMAFPWAVISKAALGSGHLVEDLKLGLDLARMGKPPLFCPDALVTSEFSGNAEGARTQRTRWERGHLGMIVSEAPRLLMEAVFHRNVSLFALTLDMSTPPLALLLLASLALCGTGALLVTAGGSALPLILAGIALLSIGAAVLGAWWRFGRHVISLTDLGYAPIYALRKIPLYIRFVMGKKVEWVRTRRDRG
jgi:cellulose synthase/poly-beta-1,6-N-acetylglucosamine synthase-like glycosyltransferase